MNISYECNFDKIKDRLNSALRLGQRMTIDNAGRGMGGKLRRLRSLYTKGRPLNIVVVEINDLGINLNAHFLKVP